MSRQEEGLRAGRGRSVRRGTLGIVAFWRAVMGVPCHFIDGHLQPAP